MGGVLCGARRREKGSTPDAEPAEKVITGFSLNKGILEIGPMAATVAASSSYNVIWTKLSADEPACMGFRRVQIHSLHVYFSLGNLRSASFPNSHSKTGEMLFSRFGVTRVGVSGVFSHLR